MIVFRIIVEYACDMDLGAPVLDVAPAVRGALLQALARLEQPVTRRQLAAAAGVSPGNASAVIEDLIRAGLVNESVAGRSSMVLLNRSHLAVGPLLALAGLRGELIRRMRERLSEWPDLEGAWLFGQAARDGYVGFVEAAALQPIGPLPTHRVAAIRTYAFAEPSIKSRASGPYSINALVAVEAVEGRLAKVAGAGWMTAAHLAPIGTVEEDWAAVAERFVGAPYLWGGRESLGLDCSGLVQQALFACGLACPRDTDMQQDLGVAIEAAQFGRGDLVFWTGHVAIGLGDGMIVHANGHHMATAIEPLAVSVARISAGGSEVTAYRRL